MPRLEAPHLRSKVGWLEQRLFQLTVNAYGTCERLVAIGEMDANGLPNGTSRPPSASSICEFHLRVPSLAPLNSSDLTNVVSLSTCQSRRIDSALSRFRSIIVHAMNVDSRYNTTLDRSSPTSLDRDRLFLRRHAPARFRVRSASPSNRDILSPSNDDERALWTLWTLGAVYLAKIGASSRRDFKCNFIIVQNVSRINERKCRW